MTAENIRKIKRLIAFRERQRDIDAKEMDEARRNEAHAESERDMAMQALDGELNAIRDITGKSITPEDLALAEQSAKWAQSDLRKSENQLAQKKHDTEARRAKLLASHKRVKQMETLHTHRKEALERDQSLKQQSEIDDLTATREAHR
ncbi:MAG: hypothetical protein JXX14_25745 [Deltaproteobacteria bacterium]|nr:hypothetical protein [Deltaproteobacteria bacterium]